MKKRFFAFFSVILLSFISLFSFNACGCVGPQAISFNDAFVKGYGESVPTNYFEKLTYEVNYRDDMYDYTISDKLDSDKFTFSKGEYTTELSIIDEIPIESLKDNEIYKSLAKTDKIYSYKTLFTIPVSYKTFDGEKSFNDKIETITYFCSQGMSFAPIYSNTKATYSVFSYSNGNYYAVEESYQSTFVYGIDYYTLTLKANDLEAQTTEHEYDYKCLIDNTQLLFAVRNLGLSKDTAISFDVASATYKDKTNLAVYYVEEQTESTKQNGSYPGLTFNGVKIEEDVKVDKLRYKVNSTSNGGKEHFVFIKSSSTSGVLPNNAYMLKYVQPLICYGNFEVMGSLEFSLVNISQA